MRSAFGVAPPTEGFLTVTIPAGAAAEFAGNGNAPSNTRPSH